MARAPKITPQIPGEPPVEATDAAAETPDEAEVSGKAEATQAGEPPVEADRGTILEFDDEDVDMSRRILAAHAKGLTSVDLSEPLPDEAADVTGTSDPFDANGIAYAAKGRMPHLHEVDTSRIKRAVLTTGGYVVPEPKLHPAQRP